MKAVVFSLLALLFNVAVAYEDLMVVCYTLIPDGADASNNLRFQPTSFTIYRVPTMVATCKVVCSVDHTALVGTRKTFVPNTCVMKTLGVTHATH
jgi:hypothetical protein